MEPWGSIFLVLSGFLITKILLSEYQKTQTADLWNFYYRRASRIFPAAGVFLIIATVLDWKNMRLYHIVAAAFSVSNMDIPRRRIFGHLWSLAIEEQFYLLWPLLLTRSFKRRYFILAVALVGPLFFIAALYWFKPGIAPQLYDSLFGQADKLAIGCLLALCADHLPPIRKRWAACAVALCVAIPLFPPVTAIRTVISLGLLRPLPNLSIAAALWHVMANPYWLLNCKPAVWLGKISYSVYLWQEVFCAGRGSHLPAFALVTFTLACATASYHLIEQPFLRLRRDSSLKAKPGNPPVLAQVLPQR
jgi:peptidoglycan/LPS O-acetylase OafA/YrhL